MDLGYKSNSQRQVRTNKQKEGHKKPTGAQHAYVPNWGRQAKADRNPTTGTGGSRETAGSVKPTETARHHRAGTPGRLRTELQFLLVYLRVGTKMRGHTLQGPSTQHGYLEFVADLFPRYSISLRFSSHAKAWLRGPTPECSLVALTPFKYPKSS